MGLPERKTRDRRAAVLSRGSEIPVSLLAVLSAEGHSQLPEATRFSGMWAMEGQVLCVSPFFLRFMSLT